MISDEEQRVRELLYEKTFKRAMALLNKLNNTVLGNQISSPLVIRTVTATELLAMKASIFSTVDVQLYES